MRLLTKTVTTVLLFLVLAPIWAEESIDVELSIAEQPLSTSLREVASSFDLTIAFYSESTDGLQGPALDGDFTSEAALDTLLADTNLEYTFVDDSSVAVRPLEVADQGGDSDSGNMKSAPILMAQNTSNQATTVGSRSDDRGNRKNEDDDPAATSLEEIVVIGTGTNIRGVENPTVPVLTFDRKDIALSGAATVDDFLRTIPQNFASNTQLTNESGNPNTAPNVTQGTVVDLRGLGAGSTLTLLNGRRMTPAGISNFVDVNVLPLGVIERVDLLLDGATAVYGSDAVGGVINFVTRKDYEGFDVSARYGRVTDGSKEDWGIGAAGGLSWGSGGVFAGVDYHAPTPLRIDERDFVDLLLPNEGTTFGADFERFSIAGGVNQELNSSARIGIDLLYSDTTSEANSISSFIPSANASNQEALLVNTVLEYEVSDTITASAFMDYGINDVSANTVILPSGFESLSVFDNELLLLEGRLSGQLVDLTAGPVSFSIGGLHREEKYDTDQSSGVFVVAAERSVSAAYLEVLIPVFGEGSALPIVQELHLSFAGRYEDYSDVGDSLDPKFGVYWEMNDALSVRASYSESFRAPDLQTLNSRPQYLFLPFPLSSITAFPTPPPSSLETPLPFDFVIVGFFNGTDPFLTSESAKSWSAGFTYIPAFVQGLSISGNYFDVTYEDRIEGISVVDPLRDASLIDLVNTDPTLADIEDLYARGAAGEFEIIPSGFGEGPEDVRILVNSGLQNISSRDVRGIDLTLDYAIDTTIGQVSASVNANYLINYVSRLTDLSPAAEQLNVLYRPVDFKMRANLSWSISGFTIFTALNYVDGYRDDIDPSISNDIASWTTVDLSLAYDTDERLNSAILDNLSFGFSVTNLFDEDPPFVATPFGLNYDSANANPFNRQVNFAVAKRFQ